MVFIRFYLANYRNKEKSWLTIQFAVCLVVHARAADDFIQGTVWDGICVDSEILLILKLSSLLLNRLMHTGHFA